MLSYLQAIPVSEQSMPTWWFFPSRKKKHKKDREWICRKFFLFLPYFSQSYRTVGRI
ncbi:MAG: hypothetical protein ACFFDX_03005 [Candidatus Odinarchaeota archaeon]